MVGSGIFIVSADILRQVRAPGLLLVVWALAGLVSVFGALTQGELGVGLRYNLYTGTPIVPFARLGGGTRFLFFTWGSDDRAEGVVAAALTGALGMQIAVAPFFGVELGALVDYTFGMDAFEAGFVSISPFAGVTLYLFDESDALTAP